MIAGENLLGFNKQNAARNAAELGIFCIIAIIFGSKFL